MQRSYVTCGNEEKWVELEINEQKGQKGGNAEKWGPLVMQIVAEWKNPGEAKATLSEVETDAGAKTTTTQVGLKEVP